MNTIYESWELFRWTFLAALFLGLSLSALGVVVVTRGQVFLAAAVSQASLLGLSVNLWMGWTYPMATATAFSGMAALATARRRNGGPGVSGEETTGWLFLACASLAILVLAKQPVGLREVQAMMSSSVIGATPGDVLFFGGMAVVALGFVLMARRRLVVLVTDPTMAAAVGMRVGWWTSALALAMGVGTGVAMRSTGMLYTFGCLVLPPLVAKNLCREVAPMFWVAPLVAAGSVAVGLVVAHTWDFPPGQTMVAVQALALLAAWGWREGRTWMWE